MNLRTLKAVVLGLLMAAAPALMAQQTDDDSSTETKTPKFGVRFVVCTTGSEQLPSPLYVKVGKDYRPTTISKMMPCPRITPEPGGVIRFYDRLPEKSKKEKIEPLFTVNVPEGHRGSTARSICILQPRKDKEPLTFFIKESEFKRGGVHIVNFTDYTLEIITDPTGKFEGKEKREKIAPRVKTQNISSSDPNTWSYYGKGKADEKASYVLQTAPRAGSTEGKRIRAGVLMTSSGVSQVSIVVNHPKLKNTCSLLSVQFSDEEAQAAARKAAQ